MLDITTNLKEKENFITKVYVKENDPNYHILYANGLEMERKFTVHNFNATLEQMEEQLVVYKKDYLAKVDEFYQEIIKKQILEIGIGLLGIYLTINMDLNNMIKIIISILIMALEFYLQLKNRLNKINCQVSYEKINLYESFIQNKENFSVPVIDPLTNTKENWYMINLSDIDDLENFALYNQIYASLDEETKEVEGHAITLKLKNMFGENKNDITN